MWQIHSLDRTTSPIPQLTLQLVHSVHSRHPSTGKVVVVSVVKDFTVVVVLEVVVVVFASVVSKDDAVVVISAGVDIALSLLSFPPLA